MNHLLTRQLSIPPKLKMKFNDTSGKTITTAFSESVDAEGTVSNLRNCSRSDPTGGLPAKGQLKLGFKPYVKSPFCPFN